MFCKLTIKLALLVVISSCSTMGKVAKGTYEFGLGVYKAQPKVMTDNYPHLFKQTFYSAELFITDYDLWQIRIVSKTDISIYVEKNDVFVDLEYEMDFQTYRKTVPLVFKGYSILTRNKQEFFAFDFSFSPEGKEFWQTYHERLFKFDRPWFNYPISPILPLEIKREIDSIEYAYVPDWGFLTLREFMNLFRGMKKKRWEEFCFYNNYAYDDSSVCGDIQIEDEPEIIKVTTN